MTPFPLCRSVLIVARLLLPAALLASASNAWTQEIRYFLVNYPTQSDGSSSPISVFGLITTDGALGSITFRDLQGTSVHSISGSGGSVDLMPNSYVQPQALYSTPDELMLLPGDTFKESSAFGGGTFPPPDPRNSQVIDNFSITNYGNGTALYTATQSTFSDPGIQLSIPDLSYKSILNEPTDGASSGTPWVIATVTGNVQPPEPVPEPTSITLLVSALPGLAAIYLPRKFAVR